MKDDNENLIVQKSKAFAIRCVNLYKYLVDTKREFVMSKQLLRCGTSIGANVKEAMRESMLADCRELLRLLTSIVKSTFKDK